MMLNETINSGQQSFISIQPDLLEQQNTVNHSLQLYYNHCDVTVMHSNVFDALQLKLPCFKCWEPEFQLTQLIALPCHVYHPCLSRYNVLISLIWWYRRAMEFLNVSRIHHFRISNVSGKLHGNPSIHYCQKAMEISISRAVPHVWLKDSVGDRWEWHEMSLLLKHPHCWKS